MDKIVQANGHFVENDDLIDKLNEIVDWINTEDARKAEAMAQPGPIEQFFKTGKLPGE